MRPTVAKNPLSLEGKGAPPEYAHRGGMGDNTVEMAVIPSVPHTDRVVSMDGLSARPHSRIYMRTPNMVSLV